MVRHLICAVLLTIAMPPSIVAQVSAAAVPSPAALEQTHQQLRALKDRLVAAVNTRNEAALVAELDTNIWFTAMNNETFHGLGGAKAYFTRMMVGSGRVVDSMSLAATPDTLSILYADSRAAVSTGTVTAHFRLTGGSEFDVPLRWTTMLVNDGQQWRVASAHFSANMFDNPILGAFRKLSYAIAGGLALVGLLIGWLLGRRSRRAA
jgi:hypothetical protein